MNIANAQINNVCVAYAEFGNSQFKVSSVVNSIAKHQSFTNAINQAEE